MKTTVHGGSRTTRKVEQPASGGGDLRKIPVRWRWHYRTLALLRDNLLDERAGGMAEAKVAIEPHSLHEADSATDEFDHAEALVRLSATQEALYEVEAALRRIRSGAYGRCERTGKRIDEARLRAVPWTRFCVEVEQEVEREAAKVSREKASARMGERVS